jgi:hypothetical protein
VIGALEDEDDYKAFEAAITADYDSQSAVERELVLRLASLLWLLRRATTIEAGLFEIQAEHLSEVAKERRVASVPRQIIAPILNQRSLQPDHETPALFVADELKTAAPLERFWIEPLWACFGQIATGSCENAPLDHRCRTSAPHANMFLSFRLDLGTIRSTTFRRSWLEMHQPPNLQDFPAVTGTDKVSVLPSPQL